MPVQIFNKGDLNVPPKSPINIQSDNLGSNISNNINDELIGKSRDSVRV